MSAPASSSAGAASKRIRCTAAPGGASLLSGATALFHPMSLWHIAHYVLVGSKVGYLSNFSAAPRFGERPETAHSRASR